MVAPNSHVPTLYFGYGSNLCIDKMKRRCPGSKLVGRGLLRDWKWIISESGYANIVLSPGDTVYGLIYQLSEAGEASLDRSEGVPHSYSKEMVSVEFVSIDPLLKAVEVTQGVAMEEPKVVKEVMTYVNREHTKYGQPREEYIGKINQGVIDGVKYGIPEEYFETYIRPFIRPPILGEEGELGARYSFDPQLADALILALSTALNPTAG